MLICCPRLIKKIKNSYCKIMLQSIIFFKKNYKDNLKKNIKKNESKKNYVGKHCSNL
jgi:hypothetical protein